MLSIWNIIIKFAVGDPDLELRWRGVRGGGEGLDLLHLLAFFSFVFSSLPKIRGGDRAPQAPPLDPPLVCGKITPFKTT